MKKILLLIALLFAFTGTVALAADKPDTNAFGNAIFTETGGYFVPPHCLGISEDGDSLSRDGAIKAQKECTLTDMLQVGLNISRLILGIIGSAALIMFVYGGLMFVLAAGNKQRVETGKTIITNAVLGIAVVLFSWVIVNTLVAGLTGTDVSNPKVFDDTSPFVLPETK